ncbi:MAG: HdaA/DnaA family protein [Pseudomarimonas sp.]
MSKPAQLPLALRHPIEQRFQCFLPADAAEPPLLIAAIKGGQRVYIDGPSGSGKSHLLLACAAAASEVGKSVAYLPLATLGAHASAALEAQDCADLICIDELDAVHGASLTPQRSSQHADSAEPSPGNTEVERALFALHNRQGDAGGTLIYAARAAPAELAIDLPDLRSRLAHCLRLTLKPLSEPQRRELLVARAQRRGLALEDAALDYLFRRVGRDLATLTTLLDQLDRESLAAKRRLSVPFLREVLERGVA